jgi:hypothetical protein
VLFQYLHFLINCQTLSFFSLTFSSVNKSFHKKRPLGVHKDEWLNGAGTQVGLTVHEHSTTQRRLTVFGKQELFANASATALSSLIHWQATDANTRKADSVYVLIYGFKNVQDAQAPHRL